MNEEDFKSEWLTKFSCSLQEIAGEEIRKKIMKGSENLPTSSREEMIAWSKKAIDNLDSLVDEKKRVDIMTNCTCQYPHSELDGMRKAYEETKDIDTVHQMLQQRFISFLKNGLNLDDRLIKDLREKGWGLAGIKKGDTIIATKIPESSLLIEYMKETDPEKKRALYCHCPRVRAAISSGTKFSPTYCYCGAGFYRGIWEYILQRPVSVEVLESVLQGDDVCRIAIYLTPEGAETPRKSLSF